MKTKKTVAFLMATVMLVLSFVVNVSAEVQSGDVDLNGTVTSEDARLALRYAVGLETLAKQQITAGDMDGDGKITAADARKILRKSVGLTDFETILFNVARQYYYPDQGYGASATQMLKSTTLLEVTYRTSGKWCCYYTVNDVFRPALQQAGYSEERINQLAPIHFDAAKISKAATVVIKEALESEKVTIPKSAFSKNTAVYIPSLLMDYYRVNNGTYDTFYTFFNYYDDMLTNNLYVPDTDAKKFTPKVGDVVFMSNKSRTYYNGIPTVDHTAQIIQVYSDGSFLCTEGSIIIEGQPDNLPRVRERIYVYDRNIGTYVYQYNNIVRVLAIARPNLY